MLRDTLVDMIALKLGNRDDLNTAIIAEMQLGQEFRLEQNGRFQPWFMITELATINTVAEEPRVALPSSFVAEVEEGGLWYLDTLSDVWVPIQKGDDSTFQSWALGSGAPKYYSVLGDHITLFPTPDAIYTLRMRFAAKQTALTTNIENNWLKYASDLMLYDTAQKIAAENLQNVALAQTFGAAKETAWDRLYVMHEQRQHTNREYTMGGK